MVLGLKTLVESPPFESFVSFVKQHARKNCLNDSLVTSHPALSLSFQFLSMWECLKLSILKLFLFPWTPWSTYGSQRVVQLPSTVPTLGIKLKLSCYLLARNILNSIQIPDWIYVFVNFLLVYANLTKIPYHVSSAPIHH